MTNLDQELEIMSSLATVIDAIDDHEARDRVLRWVFDRYNQTGAVLDSMRAEDDANITSSIASQGAPYSNFADLYDAVNPSSLTDRAIVAGYWLQVVNSDNTWNSFAVNKLLKDLGYGIDGISKVFARAQKQSPVLVRQTSKSGRAAQAKKTYRLTQAGINVVKGMLSNG